MTEWNDQVPTASDIFANSQAYRDLMKTMQNMIDSFNANQGNQGTEVHPTTDELDQFHKSWFYNNWSVRFRRLMSFTPLGTRGVIAIPNTTFEEWLWWFHEWMQAFMEDYNAFKKLVLEAIQAIEKHLELIDKEIDDIEKHLQDIDDHLKRIDEEINQINQKLQDLQNQINEINQKIQNLQDQINNLTNKVNQNDQAHKNEENHLQQEIDDLRNQLKSNIAPNWINATQPGEGAVNGWVDDSSAPQHALNIQYRWLNQDDHSQGLYLSVSLNHCYNPNYSPGQKDTMLDVDLTNFVNETHAIIPNEQWPSSSGSYYTSNQRNGFGLHWKYDSNSHHMTVNIEYRDGVYAADKWPDKIVLINGGCEIYCPVSQS